MTVLDLIPTIAPKTSIRIHNMADDSTYDFKTGVMNTKKVLQLLTEHRIIDARVTCVCVLFTARILYIECYKMVQST